MFRDACSTVWTYAPAAIFVAVAGTMNLMFAETLGSSDTTQRLWQVVAVGSALVVVRAPGQALLAFREREWARFLACLAILAPALAYEVTAAYGFANMEQHVTTQHAEDVAKKKRDAENDVHAAEARLAPYLSAPDLTAARAVEKAARDAAPSTCQNARADRARELCDAVAAAARDVAAAEARARLQSQVDDARRKADALPAAPPPDARRELPFGPWLTEWLPVVMLTTVSLLGFFAVTPRKSTRAHLPTRAHQPAPKPSETSPAPAQASATPSSSVAQLSIAAAVADAIGRADALPGLSVDDEGFLCGNQRNMAKALGRPLTSLNRALLGAADAGALVLDTTGNLTRVKPAA